MNSACQIMLIPTVIETLASRELVPEKMNFFGANAAAEPFKASLVLVSMSYQSILNILGVMKS